MELRNSLSVNNHGKIRTAEAVVEIPRVQVRRLLACGANACVFVGDHEFLSRTVAVKLWLLRNSKDRRDKFRQGMLEAQKAAAVNPDRRVVTVYDAGLSSGFFYAVLEYYPGKTLQQWLADRHPRLSVRSNLAHALLLEDLELMDSGCVHGDLHTRNILINANHVDRTSFDPILIPTDYSISLTRCEESKGKGNVTIRWCPEFRIIDFGTSRFTSKTFSVARHWKVLDETIRQLSYPFDIHELWEHRRPADDDSIALHQWYWAFLNDLPAIVRAMGATCFRHCNGQPKKPCPHPDPLVMDTIERLRKCSDISVEREVIGDSGEWGMGSSRSY